MGHRDGTPGPLDSKEGDGEGISTQDLDNRGEHRVGEEMRGTGKLQVKMLQEKHSGLSARKCGSGWL